MNQLQKAILKAVAITDQFRSMKRAWEERLPNHFRQGDVIHVHHTAIKSQPGYTWLLVRHHPDNVQLWMAAIVDDRNGLIGKEDLLFEGALSKHVVRPSVMTWLHEDDMKLDNRLDHATESTIDFCKSRLGRITPEQVAGDNEEVDDDYLDHLDDLQRWTQVITYVLHTDAEDADVAKAVDAYWEAADC